MTMTPELLAALFNTIGPIARDIIAKHQAATGQLPTDEEMRAALLQNIDGYLAEGASWTSGHKAVPNG